jgi:hypothetical protein
VNVKVGKEWINGIWGNFVEFTGNDWGEKQRYGEMWEDIYMNRRRSVGIKARID